MSNLAMEGWKARGRALNELYAVLSPAVGKRTDDPVGDLKSLVAERDLFRDELREAHSWMLAQGWCDCEHFEGIGTKPCRFAEALDASPTDDAQRGGTR